MAILWFHRLSAGKGTKPFKLAPWPVLILPQALVCALADVTVAFTALDVAAPGVGLVTVTGNVPADGAAPEAVS